MDATLGVLKQALDEEKKANGNEPTTMIVADAPPGGVIVSPAEQHQSLSAASALATSVARIIEEKGLSRRFGASDKAHVFVEGWLTISRVQNEQPHTRIEDVTRDADGNELIHARAWITDAKKQVVSEADAYVSTDEPNWRNRPFYARASMAQTRAIAKAMRLRHAWVMVLAGFAPTPAEEMDGIDAAPAPAPAPKKMKKTPIPAPQEPTTVSNDSQDPADEPEGTLEVATIMAVSEKSGEKNGKTWTRYGVKVRFAGGEEQWLNTFDANHGALAESLKGKQAYVTYEQNAKGYYDLLNIQEVTAKA